MNLTCELMGLRESHNQAEDFEDLDLWANDGLENVDVEVEFDYEGASYTDHPYGMGTAREHHPANIDLISVKLKNDAKLYDKDGNHVIRILKKGTDLMNEEFWKDSDADWFINQLHDKADNDDDDFDEPDDDRHCDEEGWR